MLNKHHETKLPSCLLVDAALHNWTLLCSSDSAMQVLLSHRVVHRVVSKSGIPDSYGLHFTYYHCPHWDVHFGVYCLVFEHIYICVCVCGPVSRVHIYIYCIRAHIYILHTYTHTCTHRYIYIYTHYLHIYIYIVNLHVTYTYRDHHHLGGRGDHQTLGHVYIYIYTLYTHNICGFLSQYITSK